jgi:hypothetical protein
MTKLLDTIERTLRKLRGMIKNTKLLLELQPVIIL